MKDVRVRLLPGRTSALRRTDKQGRRRSGVRHPIRVGIVRGVEISVSRRNGQGWERTVSMAPRSLPPLGYPNLRRFAGSAK